MQCLCLWCGEAIPEGSDQDGNGICPTCMANLVGDVGMPIQTIVDRFPFPILVVDEDVTVTVLNKRGQEILGVPPSQVDRQSGGELFGCVHSHQPGGCGRTVHCSGCALRRAVAATYRSRESQAHVPATLKVGDPDSPEAVSLTFSTSMRGNAVLVKIDRLDR
ncbi:MAG: hypothetical protein P4L36_13435 [Holophaga sp.]|nr:hypothetical protein [Holophaga sp.]